MQLCHHALNTEAGLAQWSWPRMHPREQKGWQHQRGAKRWPQGSGVRRVACQAKEITPRHRVEAQAWIHQLSTKCTVNTYLRQSRRDTSWAHDNRTAHEPRSGNQEDWLCKCNLRHAEYWIVMLGPCVVNRERRCMQPLLFACTVARICMVIQNNRPDRCEYCARWIAYTYSIYLVPMVAVKESECGLCAMVLMWKPNTALKRFIIKQSITLCLDVYMGKQEQDVSSFS